MSPKELIAAVVVGITICADGQEILNHGLGRSQAAALQGLGVTVLEDLDEDIDSIDVMKKISIHLPDLKRLKHHTSTFIFRPKAHFLHLGFVPFKTWRLTSGKHPFRVPRPSAREKWFANPP